MIPFLSLLEHIYNYAQNLKRNYNNFTNVYTNFDLIIMRTIEEPIHGNVVKF